MFTLGHKQSQEAHPRVLQRLGATDPVSAEPGPQGPFPLGQGEPSPGSAPRALPGVASLGQRHLVDVYSVTTGFLGPVPLSVFVLT